MHLIEDQLPQKLVSEPSGKQARGLPFLGFVNGTICAGALWGIIAWVVWCWWR